VLCLQLGGTGSRVVAFLHELGHLRGGADTVDLQRVEAADERVVLLLERAQALGEPFALELELVDVLQRLGMVARKHRGGGGDLRAARALAGERVVALADRLAHLGVRRARGLDQALGTVARAVRGLLGGVEQLAPRVRRALAERRDLLRELARGIQQPAGVVLRARLGSRLGRL